LLRGTLLPAASDIYTRESALLTSSSAQATGLPLVVVAVLAGLVIGYVLGRGDMLHAQQQGSVPAQAFARAEVAVLQAHADESLTLIDNSGDDDYQKDFVAEEKLLGPGQGTLLVEVEATT